MDLSTAWAKAANGWVSLVDHSIDVAAVAEALLQIPTVSARLGTLAERELSPVDIARIGFLIGLHDAGKVNHGFQAKLRGEEPRHAHRGHIKPLWSILCTKALFGTHRALLKKVDDALLLPRWRTWASSRIDYWNTILAHHGSLPVDHAAQPEVRQWELSGKYDPILAIGELAHTMAGMFDSAFDESHEKTLPDHSRFMHALAGFVTLADWIGSDHSVFKSPDEGVPSGKDRIPWAREQAAAVVIRRWLDTSRCKRSAKGLDLSFKTLFPNFSEPKPAQKALLESPLPEPGQTVILEAETGSGKTEAALIHFIRLFQDGQVDGLYFALPTRAAAVQIHARVRELLFRWLGDSSPPVGLAVPGYIRVDDEEGQRLPDSYGVLWPDTADQDRGWAVEHSKRYLSGAVMVGTIDQVLLGGLRVRHAPFRSGPMLRLLLCIDEVHASDAYMLTLLRNVLEQHTKSGGNALLMSATLGAYARIRLLNIGRVENSLLPTMQQAVAQAYPCIVRANEELNPLANDRSQKRVTAELMDPVDDLESLWDRLKAAAEAGAAVLFIRNRVADVQDTVQELEERGVRLLECEGVTAPHHSRFAPEDRRLLDQALENAFSSDKRRGIVAVTSQTAEQSLDICADWLVTDIAPGDVLLQRIGRLHRHQRARPAGFEEPRITVLAPTPDQLSATLDKKTGLPKKHTLLGLGSVYGNIIGVLAVRAWLADKAEINIPSHNRALVEATTHPEALAEFAVFLGMDGLWSKHLQQVQGEKSAFMLAAKTVAICWEDSLIDNQPIQDSQADTRLGLKDRRVPLPDAVIGPFGKDVRTLNIPGWMVEDVNEDENAELIDESPGALRFRLGARTFLYDRFGLTLKKE